jgi:hypothetical protein
MPNHVTNTLELYSDEVGLIEQVLKEISSTDDEEHSVIDFRKIVPQPDSIFLGGLGMKEEQECREQGIPDWYSWNCEYWGTKWNAYSTELLDSGEYNAVIRFDTAWSPPIPVIEALRDKYPDLHVNGGWVEEGYQSAGVF